MIQDCPKCDNQFQLQNIRDIGTLKDYPTVGKAKFCPYCGIRLDSWDAWLDKEVLIFADDNDLDGRPVILKCVNDYNEFDVMDTDTGEYFSVDSELVFTPN